MKTITLKQVLKALEKDYGWGNMFDEKGKPNFTQMQKALLMDVMNVVIDWKNKK